MIKLLAFLILSSAQSASPYKTYNVSVIDCYDGDTCTLNFHLGMNVTLGNIKVRLENIDAPEMRPLKTRVAATKTRNRLLYLIFSAESILVNIPQETKCNIGHCDKRDKYGRLIAVMYAIKNGEATNINKQLIEEGLAEYREY